MSYLLVTSKSHYVPWVLSSVIAPTYSQLGSGLQSQGSDSGPQTCQAFALSLELSSSLLFLFISFGLPSGREFDTLFCGTRTKPRAALLGEALTIFQSIRVL